MDDWEKEIEESPLTGPPTLIEYGEGEGINIAIIILVLGVVILYLFK